MNIIRTLSQRDEKLMEDLVDCHKIIFPDSPQNKLGDQYLMRFFYWYLMNQEKRSILVCQRGRRIIGFLTMRQSDNRDNFLKYIYKTVIWCFISKPILLLNILLLKKMFNYFKSNKYIRKKNKYIELVSIGVLPSYLNKGIGKQLLKEFDEYAKNNKIHLCILYILKGNKKAARFYLSNGWLKKEINVGEYDLFEKNIVCD